MSFECGVQSAFYTDEELFLTQQLPIPEHIAIIPDGNRRWAQQRSPLNLMQGHWAGASCVIPIVEAAADLGVKVLTIYSFSTENWHRNKEEIQTLFTIFKNYLDQNLHKMMELGVRFGTIGDLSPFPESLREQIEKTREATANGTTIDLVLAMNYGARDEMRRALMSMIGAVERGDLNKNQITEEVITNYLDTASYRDPELLIRTSGERRISNFLLWQLVYTEVYVTDVLWPNFTPRDLLDAVHDFQKRTRRLGR